MKEIITEWRRYITERVKPSEFYPPEFDKFLELIREHENDLWVFFDTETTGLFYKEKHVQVTQIACVTYSVQGMTEGQKPSKVDQLDVKVELGQDTLDMISQQDKEIEAGTFTDNKSIRDLLKMNQYYDGEGQAVPMESAIKKFDSFLADMREQSPSGNIVIIAQNSPFDVGVINTAYERLGLEIPDDELWDTKGALELYLAPIIRMIHEDPQASETDRKLSNALMKTSAKGGTYVATALGIVTSAFDIENKGWHNALADVQMTMNMLFSVVNYVKEKQGTYQVDTTKTRRFNATAGDPYSSSRR